MKNGRDLACAHMDSQKVLQTDLYPLTTRMALREQDQDCSFYLRHPFCRFLLWSEYPFHRLLPSRLQHGERLARNITLSTQLTYMSILSLMYNHAESPINPLRYWDTMMGMHWFLLVRDWFLFLTLPRHGGSLPLFTTLSSQATLPVDTCPQGIGSERAPWHTVCLRTRR